jgi:hypothetical protein
MNDLNTKIKNAKYLNEYLNDVANSGYTERLLVWVRDQPYVVLDGLDWLQLLTGDVYLDTHSGALSHSLDESSAGLCVNLWDMLDAEQYIAVADRLRDSWPRAAMSTLRDAVCRWRALCVPVAYVSVSEQTLRERGLNLPVRNQTGS